MPRPWPKPWPATPTWSDGYAAAGLGPAPASIAAKAMDAAKQYKTRRMAGEPRGWRRRWGGTPVICANATAPLRVFGLDGHCRGADPGRRAEEVGVAEREQTAIGTEHVV